jgi:lysozyme
MDIGKRGMELIKEFESLRLVAYYDQAGIPTIGWGTICYPDGTRVTIGQSCNAEQAEAWLQWDLRNVEACLDIIPRTLLQNQFDGLAAFVYNVGVGGFNGSTLRRELVAGRPVVEDYFLRWNKVHDPKSGKLVVSGGLTRRRKAEFALFSEV